MIEYNLNFMHPQYGTTLNVDIDGSFTIEEMIQNLLLSGFISNNPAGYDLALRDKTLARKATFEEIQELYDGAVIRIIAHKTSAPQTAAVAHILLHVKHPNKKLILDIQLSEKELLSTIIKKALGRNFIQGEATSFQLIKGDAVLDLEKTYLDSNISNGDYLELEVLQKEEQITPLQASTQQLNEKIEQLESQLHNELKSIKDALPAANMIPIDTTRAVNPTMDTYESIDTIVKRLRVDSNEQPLSPIRPMSLLVPILLVILTVILLGIALEAFNLI